VNSLNCDRICLSLLQASALLCHQQNRHLSRALWFPPNTVSASLAAISLISLTLPVFHSYNLITTFTTTPLILQLSHLLFVMVAVPENATRCDCPRCARKGTEHWIRRQTAGTKANGGLDYFRVSTSKHQSHFI
jgi:hypothetical protein